MKNLPVVGRRLKPAPTFHRDECVTQRVGDELVFLVFHSLTTSV
jgi:hypothetical protein